MTYSFFTVAGQLVRTIIRSARYSASSILLVTKITVRFPHSRFSAVPPASNIWSARPVHQKVHPSAITQVRCSMPSQFRHAASYPRKAERDRNFSNPLKPNQINILSAPVFFRSSLLTPAILGPYFDICPWLSSRGRGKWTEIPLLWRRRRSTFYRKRLCFPRWSVQIRQSY